MINFVNSTLETSLKHSKQNKCHKKIMWRERGESGTGIRGLMRGMANLIQGNQELLVVKDKVGRPQVSLG